MSPVSYRVGTPCYGMRALQAQCLALGDVPAATVTGFSVDVPIADNISLVMPPLR